MRKEPIKRLRLIYNASSERKFWSFITEQDELTPKTEALEAANRANEALKHTQKELQLARDAANVVNKVKTTFLFNMSHDIRTPMNATVGYNMQTPFLRCVCRQRGRKRHFITLEMNAAGFPDFR